MLLRVRGTYIGEVVSPALQCTREGIAREYKLQRRITRCVRRRGPYTERRVVPDTCPDGPGDAIACHRGLCWLLPADVPLTAQLATPEGSDGSVPESRLLLNWATLKTRRQVGCLREAFGWIVDWRALPGVSQKHGYCRLSQAARIEGTCSPGSQTTDSIRSACDAPHSRLWGEAYRSTSHLYWSKPSVPERRLIPR